jgi:hypothetical protein
VRKREPGAILVREWQGIKYRVVILESLRDRFEDAGGRYFDRMLNPAFIAARNPARLYAHARGYSSFAFNSL